MDLDLIKKIYNIYIKSLEELGYNIIHKNGYEIINNKNIQDIYSNFVSNFDVSNKNEFEQIIRESSKTFNKVNRKETIYLIPYMKELYKNKEKYFDKNTFELISTEVWQTYTDFNNLDKINPQCNYNVTLELTTDMKKYADILVQCYKSGDKEDPYGNLDDGYKQSYMSYKSIYNDIKTEFYFIKADGKIIGTTQSAYNDELYGIHSLAINKNYRGNGIGKIVLKKQLELCKNKNIKIAYLQTEQDFYPAKLYRKLGFKDLCETYYYIKINN